ncbi:MAG: T9SS type A sorting domain-containing protein [Saprospiraceae bacterium]
MKKKLLFKLALLLVSFHCLAQPYGGTIFVDSDIIIATDTSALEDVTYIGQANRTIFDRRVNNWITVNAFLFEVAWNDGLSSEAVINPEFGTIELAAAAAEKYGRHIGQLPHCLRIDVDEIWINKGVELFGGGNHSILIHTGQTVLYENEGILEETLVHEASHTSLDAMHAASAGWLAAQNLDGGFISDYAEEFPNREDIAESFLMWLAVRYRKDKISTADFNLITQAIPNRLDYFDEITCNLFPFQRETTTSLNDLDKEENEVVVFPNPTSGFVHLKLKNEDNFQVIVYNSTGGIVQSSHLEANPKIDLSECPNGLYVLAIRKNEALILKRVMKF